LAKVQAQVASDDLHVVDAFLAEMYGEEPTLWSDDLMGMSRLRVLLII
jgi:bis(5'-nucleosyl)-tetraphosphatase (symmetrical)